MSAYDFAGISFTEESKKGSSNMHIVIPSKDNQAK